MKLRSLIAMLLIGLGLIIWPFIFVIYQELDPIFQWVSIGIVIWVSIGIGIIIIIGTLFFKWRSAKSPTTIKNGLKAECEKLKGEYNPKNDECAIPVNKK